MRPAPQPALFAGEYCAPCPLPCVERDTGDACTPGGGARYGVHPANPDVLWQWLDWAPEPASVSIARSLPPLPAHISVMKKEITAAQVRDLPSTAIGFTITEFLGVASRAERRGTSVRALLGASGRRIVVIGADEDGTNVGRWQDWGEARERLVRHAPDLVVPPDLSIYDDEDPAPAIVHFFAHTTMHATLVAEGLCSLPPFGYARVSDIERFAAWACEQRVPGAFLDLQNRKEPKILEIADDLRQYRHLFPSSFMWLVNGCAQPRLWRELHEALGSTIFSGLGAWEEARIGNRVVAHDDQLILEPTDTPFAARLAANVETLRIAASRVVLAPVRPRRAAEQIELPLFETFGVDPVEAHVPVARRAGRRRTLR
jgi:hypothetical protein